MNANIQIKRFKEKQHKVLLMTTVVILGVLLLLSVVLSLYTEEWSGLVPIFGICFFILLNKLINR